MQRLTRKKKIKQKLCQEWIARKTKTKIIKKQILNLKCIILQKNSHLCFFTAFAKNLDLQTEKTLSTALKSWLIQNFLKWIYSSILPAADSFHFYLPAAPDDAGSWHFSSISSQSCIFLYNKEILWIFWNIVHIFKLEKLALLRNEFCFEDLLKSESLIF